MYAVFSGTISGTTLFKMIFCKVLLLVFLLVPSVFPILNGIGGKGCCCAFAKLIAYQFPYCNTKMLLKKHG